jgi:tetratricopeptide (TPR) repeat protein
MKSICALVVLSAILPALIHAEVQAKTERLGTVSFANSCSADVQTPFNRGVALLHDFWYEEARKQFEEVYKADPSCAMAHWGAAMSEYHQIWSRPNEKSQALGWAEMQKAQAPPAKTEREREYIAALAGFYQPGKPAYQARVEAYTAAMAKLFAKYPDDVDAGALYALSLLAAAPATDTTLEGNRKAMAVLTPLFARYPDHPGVVHYIIHACDTPSLAPQGLAAAERYGVIAPSAPHSAHMPGHIFARLGMWKQDIAANTDSVAASESAEAHHQSGAMDQFHSYDFLLYAYLQSGQDEKAKTVLESLAGLSTHFEAMPDMLNSRMEGMLPYYRIKLPVFYSLEMRDWQAAAALEPVAGALPESKMIMYWARTVAAGHLHDAPSAHANLVTYEALLEQLRKSKHAYMAGSTGDEIEHGEVIAWAAFADGKQEDALNKMREAADLQDKVGQAEVDIPAREMLADMLLDLHQPAKALVEYDLALKMSPNRFNGLFNAGQAAEAVDDNKRAEKYYLALADATNNFTGSSRVEVAHVKSFAERIDCHDALHLRFWEELCH